MLGQLLEMMKKAVKGAYAAKLQQYTVASGIIEAPAPVIQGEGERMVQDKGGDMSAIPHRRQGRRRHQPGSPEGGRRR